MIMSGQTMNYNRYYKSLEKMPDPIMPKNLPKAKIDINGLVDYARRKGKRVNELTEEEQNRFIIKL